MLHLSRRIAWPSDLGAHGHDNSEAIPDGGALTAMACSAAIGPMAAQPLERGHFHDSGSVVLEQFCGDLTVRLDFVVLGTFLLNPHGPDGPAYGGETLHGSVAYTNLANNKTVTTTFNNRINDLKVTDNGDGTLTILVLGAGSNKWYGPKGEILNDPGQLRWELLVDHAGTPTDPTDDGEPQFLRVVKGSTGRNDTQGLDFCEDIIHAFIG